MPIVSLHWTLYNYLFCWLRHEKICIQWMAWCSLWYLFNYWADCGIFNQVHNCVTTICKPGCIIFKIMICSTIDGL